MAGMIRVQCSAPAHAPKVAQIARLIRREDGTWTDDPLLGAEPVLQTVTVDGESRQRWSMKCRLCQRHLAARDERFQPVLDLFAAHTSDPIELSVLSVGYRRHCDQR